MMENNESDSGQGNIEEDRILTSVHEAGHAVIALVLGHAVMHASLADGVRTRYRRGDHAAQLREAMIALAGPLAEQRCRPITPAQRRALWREHWHTDLANARKHVETYGADGQWLARQVRATQSSPGT
jgi:hypothetical protein